MDDHQARAIYQYLVRNNYVDEQDNVTQDYRDDVQTGTLAPVPETLKPIEEGVHTLVQAIYDDSMLKSMFEDGNKPKVLENPLNDRFEKAEFQKLWQTINHKYAYTVDFDSEELIQKATVRQSPAIYRYLCRAERCPECRYGARRQQLQRCQEQNKKIRT